MKHHNVDLSKTTWLPSIDEWNEKSEKIALETERFAKRGRGGYAKLLSNRGLAEIPLNLKDWKALTNGYELEDGTKSLWFNTLTKYHPDEKVRYHIAIVPEDPQLPDLDRLSDSILWTVCTLLTFTRYTFTKTAIYTTIHKAVFAHIKISDWGHFNKEYLHITETEAEARERSVMALTRYCIAVLDSILTERGDLSRAVFGMVRDLIKKGFIRSTRWSCTTKRQEIANYLIDQGIHSLPTRIDQDEMIRDALTIMGRNLNTNAYRGIMYALCKNKVILKTVGGESALHKYSSKELSQIRSAARKGKCKDKENAIKTKLNAGVPLTDSERQWKHRHPELF